MFVDYGRNEYQYTTYHQICFSPNTEKTADWTQEEVGQGRRDGQDTLI